MTDHKSNLSKIFIIPDRTSRNKMTTKEKRGTHTHIMTVSSVSTLSCWPTNMDQKSQLYLHVGFIHNQRLTILLAPTSQFYHRDKQFHLYL